ncbi:pathogen-associated molecular patterns-induced protein A70 [Punica granatum]|uniref:Uncharacterized protein n=2 Tax=Punica granatum TaxID=22663 RepID=A0A2I0JZW9_PUNGR|nr:pathogen-associated molecular patterns-induced protein A70 [Punica granatum]PKI61848.1 hypothetical protein CRG98_017746 [Punica granatum]
MADPSALAASSTTMWAFMASWFTPTSLFLLLNLMIGTIFISSRFHSSPASKKTPTTYHYQYGHPDSAPPLARTPSLIDRVRSINFSLYKFDHHPVPDYHYSEQPADHFAAHVDPPPPPIARAPSLLERLKSINFTPYIFDHPTPAMIPEPKYAPPADPAPLARAPSLLDRLKSINFSPYLYNHPDPIREQDAAPAQAYSEPARTRQIRNEPPPVAPVPSFLERVKSINFSLYGQEEPDLAGLVDHHVKRVNSDTKPTGGEAPTRLSRKMKKSASDKSSFSHFKSEDEEEEEEDVAEFQRPETKKGPAVAAVEEAEEIDAKADDFINRFKQQLKLQRLDSIMRYKEMLSRGSANAN